jgi:WD40 repeat protein
MNDVAFNHDGTMLATTGDDSAARVWDPETGEELRSLEGPPDNAVGGPSFSRVGSLFAAAWPLEGMTRVMDLTTGRTVREITAVAGPGRTSFSPDGQRIVIGSFYQPVAVVVDVSSGAEVFTLSGHKAPISDVAWSPDGRWIATASADGSTRIWEAETGRPRFRLSGHTADVFAVDWSPDSTRLVTGSTDGTARVWRITQEGATGLLSLSSQGTRSGVAGAAFSPDGDRVMTGDGRITAVEVWDVSITGDAEWANLPAVPLFEGSAAFTPDGRRLVASTVDGSATIWDPATGARLLTFGANRPSADPDRLDVFAIDPLVDGPSGTDLFAIDVSSDGALVATASANGSARVWDAATGDEMFTVRSRQEVDDVAWSPAGDLLATASADSETDTGLVTIVDRSGDQVAALPEESGVRFGSVRFSPDGRQLLTTSFDTGDPTPTGNDVNIWDWERGEVVRTIEALAQRAIYDPTGALIATTAGVDGVAEIWDSETGQKIATLAGHTGGVEAVAFSADGTRLASAGADGTVRLWDPRAGEQLLVLRGHAGLVSSVSFSPDVSRLASVGADGYVRVWALDLDDLIEIAEGELTRTFTDVECRQYLHVPNCPSS